MNPNWYLDLLEVNVDLDLVFEREVDLPVSALWKSWTDPEEILHWFTPKPWQTTGCRIDLRVGGEFYTQMKSPDGTIVNNFGCFLLIIPERLLVFTDTMFAGLRPSGNVFSTIFLHFTPIDANRSKYSAIVKHKDAETKKKHEEMGFQKGWGITLDQLVTHSKEKKV